LEEVLLLPQPVLLLLLLLLPLHMRQVAAPALAPV
jgi:hypothetical protein